MEVQEIKRCRICGNTDLIPVLDLGLHSLSGIFPKKEDPDPIDAPLTLLKCNDENNSNVCGLLQLKHNVPGELMYLNNYGYRSGINRTMTNHLKGIADEIKSKVSLSQGDVILDIGSNDATLLKFFDGLRLNRIGIDPTGEQFKSYYPNDIILLSDFFTFDNFKKTSPYQKAKVITSIAMFYDLKDPMEFVKDIKDSLHSEGMWFMEQSYMPSMLNTDSFDTICHEHLEYYSLKQIKWVLDIVGLRIVDVDFNNANGGSFRISVCHKSSPIQSKQEKIDKILEFEVERGLHTIAPYLEFKQRVESIRENLRKFILEEKRQGRSIYVYGASTKGNTLLQYFGIGNDLITAAADRNPEKHGRRTPKTNIPIISEEEARKSKPDNFLVLPWHFKEEFLERENEYLENGGRLIFPLPKFELITKRARPEKKEDKIIKAEDEKVEKAEKVKKKALITGITGQIGSYLAELLVDKGYEVYGLVRRTSSIVGSRERIDPIKGLKLIYGDLCDSGSIEKIIHEVQPDEIYNLAAQSHVGISFETPENTSDINALGVLRICEAAKRLKKKVKIYQASTSELYGGIYDYPVNEEAPFYPKSPYGIAKLYAYWTMRHYRETYNMYCSNGLVFNSESPRRGENFVTRKIVKNVVSITNGSSEILRLGNLNAKRDWSHAKDSARAMWLILQAEKPGDYVIASGKTRSVREFVEKAFNYVGVNIKWRGDGLNEEGYDEKTGKVYVKVDPHYFRPSEVNTLIGDSTKAKKELGWSQEYSFEDLVKDMMEHELA